VLGPPNLRNERCEIRAVPLGGRRNPGHGKVEPFLHVVLVMHGDDDGVVDFRQGLQYYNYARRAGKPVVMLMYPGAGHGLSEEKQQVDYHRRILEWFDHYLKGEPPARWITEGESWSERERRLEGG
jgi:acetyl esterase/lipase